METDCRVRVVYERDARNLYEDHGLAYATPHAAGMDLRACFAPGTDELRLNPGERGKAPSGIRVEPLTPGVAGFVYSRSGLGAVQGVVVAQGTGVIDWDYRGEIVVFLLNTSAEERVIRRGERVAQLVFQPVLRATLEEGPLGDTERGAGGFGHTGTK